MPLPENVPLKNLKDAALKYQDMHCYMQENDATYNAMREAGKEIERLLAELEKLSGTAGTNYTANTGD